MKPIRFSSAMEAVAWAEEVSSRPVCGTLLSRLLIKDGYGGLSPQELRDMALSITNAAADIKKPWGLFFLSVYGATNVWAIIRVQQALAQDLRQTEYATGKDVEQLQKLVGAICETIRRKALHGKPLSRSRIASIVGLDRRRFCEDGWPELEAMVRESLEDRLDSVERELNNVLRDMDLLT